MFDIVNIYVNRMEITLSESKAKDKIKANRIRMIISRQHELEWWD